MWEPKVTHGIWDADDGCASIDEDRIALEGAADADDADRIPCGRAADNAEVSDAIGYGDGEGLDEGCHDGYSEGSNGWFIPYWCEVYVP